MKRARFVCDADALLADILPPGNKITGAAVTEAGKLVFEFEGIDVPQEVAGTPMLVLMGCRSAEGEVSYWFEQPIVHDLRLKWLSFPRSDPL
jgi:hypothetical protein